MAEQYDISWLGWAWRGTNPNNVHRPCKDGMAECHQPDIRDIDDAGGVSLTDGKNAGANWKRVWSVFVQDGSAVLDVKPQNINKTDDQPAGFLPRPCIVGVFNLSNICGWDSTQDILQLSPSEFSKQSVYDSILPGIPGHCTAQSCEGFTCGTYTGPCSGTPPAPAPPSPPPSPPSPLPPSPPSPAPPSPGPTSGQCCYGSCGVQCQTGWCSESESQCTGN